MLAIASTVVKEFIRTAVSSVMLLPVYILVISMVKARYEAYLDLDPNLAGLPREDCREVLKESVFYGIVAGFAITFIVMGVGVPISTEGFTYLLWIIAGLALVNLRYASFPYAAGILMIISLLFKEPSVNIPALLFLVGGMNLLESFLGFTHGAKGSVPVFIKHPQGIVGAFVIRRYWPVPLLLLSFTVGGDSRLGSGLMPGWWPLFKPQQVLTGAAGLALDCAIGILGYSHIAVTRLPEKKSREAAGLVLVNGLGMFLAGWLSCRFFWAKCAGAVLAVAGHAAVGAYGHYREKNGKPIFKAESRGVKVLEVLPGGAGMRMGIQRGDVLLRVNGKDIQTEEGLRSALSGFPTFVWVTVRDTQGDEKTYEYTCYPAGVGGLDVLTVPRKREVTYTVDMFEDFGIVKNLVQRFRGVNRPF